MVGRLKQVDLRSAWVNEAKDFTSWLSDNLDILSDHIDYEISILEREKKTGSFSARDWEGTLGYGRGVRRVFFWGVNARHVESRIEDAAARTTAMDMGFLYRPERKGFLSRLSVGAALRNLGPGARYIEKKAGLPKSLELGASFRSAMARATSCR